MSKAEGVEAFARFLGRVLNHVEDLAGELRPAVQPTYPIDAATIALVKGNCAALRWLLNPVVSGPGPHDLDALSGYGVEPVTLLSFFAVSSSRDAQRAAKWLLNLAERIDRNVTRQQRPIAQLVQELEDAAALLRGSIPLVQEPADTRQAAMAGDPHAAAVPTTDALSKEAREIALEVDKLVACQKNRHEFEKQIEAFKKEAVQQKQKRKKEEDALHKVEQKAIRAVWKEMQAVAAGKAKPRLTDEASPPGDRWLWRPECYREFDDQCMVILEEWVTGWFPPELIKAHEQLVELQNREWPGPDPSWATMFTLLAAFRDVFLSNVQTVLDPLTDIPAEASRSKDPGAMHLLAVRLWCMTAMDEKPDRLDSLESYLNHVSEYLVMNSQSRVADERPESYRPPRESESETQRAREMAREVNALYHTGQNADTWQQHIKVFEQEADEHWDAVAKATSDKKAAIEAVWKEQEDIAAGKRKRRRLTDPDEKPGDEYARKTEVYDIEPRPEGGAKVYYAIGWMPVEPFERYLDLTADWPWSRPSLAAKFALLALLHDTHFADRTSPICEPNVWWKVFGGEPSSVAFHGPFRTFRDLLEAEDGPPLYGQEHMDALETFLNHVKRELAGCTDGLMVDKGEARAVSPEGKSQRRQPAGAQEHEPDEDGMVREPLDKTAYCPASKIVQQYPDMFRGHKKKYKRLKTILAAQRKAIRRCKPRENRLMVHLGDWLDYLERESNYIEKAKTLIARDPVWRCKQCRNAYVNSEVQGTRCPSPSCSGELEPIYLHLKT